MKNILFVFTLIFYFLTLKAQAQQGNSVFQIYTKPTKVKLTIVELELKTKIESEEPLIIDNLAEGNYHLKFKIKSFKLSEDFYLPPNDTLTIFADFYQMGVVSASANELRALVKENKEDNSKENPEESHFVFQEPMQSNFIMELHIPVSEVDSLTNVYSKRDSAYLQQYFNDQEFHYFAEQSPVFNEGKNTSFYRYFSRKLHLPVDMAEDELSGLLNIIFTIDEYGRPRNVEVNKETPPSLRKEIVEVIMNSPTWTPGKIHGENVSVIVYFEFELTVSFFNRKNKGD